jgi:hypothetical protein
LAGHPGLDRKSKYAGMIRHGGLPITAERALSGGRLSSVS